MDWDKMPLGSTPTTWKKKEKKFSKVMILSNTILNFKFNYLGNIRFHF